jgi:hypothetical protein
MRIVIDTSSLLALVRYYIPFDKDDSLKKFVIEKIDAGEIIILDKVFEESKFVSKGIIIKELNPSKNKIVKTKDTLPTNKFFNQLENQFCYGSQKNRLSSTEFETQKNRFLDSADAKQILYCINDRDSLGIDKPILVTEETQSENDSKLFKKLPEICTMLEVEHCNLAALLKDHFKINLSKYLK